MVTPEVFIIMIVGILRRTSSKSSNGYGNQTTVKCIVLYHTRTMGVGRNSTTQNQKTIGRTMRMIGATFREGGDRGSVPTSMTMRSGVRERDIVVIDTWTIFVSVVLSKNILDNKNEDWI